MHGLNKHLAAEIKRGKFEMDDKGGLYLPRSRVFVGGEFEVTHRRADGDVLSVERFHNMVPQEGRQYILDVVFAGLTAAAELHIGLIEGDYTPDDTITMAELSNETTECVSYSQADRPEYERALPIVSDTASNSANRAIFTFTADKDIYGGFLCTNAAKGSSSGNLLAIQRFPSTKSVLTTEELTVAYLFSVADT